MRPPTSRRQGRTTSRVFSSERRRRRTPRGRNSAGAALAPDRDERPRSVFGQQRKPAAPTNGADRAAGIQAAECRWRQKRRRTKAEEASGPQNPRRSRPLRPGSEAAAHPATVEELAAAPAAEESWQRRPTSWAARRPGTRRAGSRRNSDRPRLRGACVQASRCSPGWCRRRVGARRGWRRQQASSRRRREGGRSRRKRVAASRIGRQSGGQEHGGDAHGPSDARRRAGGARGGERTQRGKQRSRRRGPQPAAERRRR